MKILVDRPLSELNFTDIDAFLREEHGEGITLDYKLLPSFKDKDKAELSKDVSALANSQGGLIFYGVAEVKPDRIPKFPLDGTSRWVSNQPVEEWAAQVIRDGIQPRLDLEIEAFELPSNPDSCILVIRVEPSPLAPHMVTFKANNRYYGRFYRRSNYENRIAEEYEVREMLERARRLYLGIEDELARRGYSDPRREDFGDNPYTLRLACPSGSRESVQVRRWVSFVMLPTLPAEISTVNRKEWLRWLQESASHHYEPDPGDTFIPTDIIRPILGGFACLKLLSEEGSADLSNFVRVGLDGSVEFGFCPARISTKKKKVPYLRGRVLLTRLWQFIEFANAVRHKVSMFAPHLLVINIRGRTQQPVFLGKRNS